MTVEGKVLPCSHKGCKRDSVGKSLYCSDSCRAKASHAKLYKRVQAKPSVQTWTGEMCWCGRPGRYPENGRPKCGNHNATRRTQKDRWRRLVKEMQKHLTHEEAKEAVRLAIAGKLVQDYQAA